MRFSSYVKFHRFSKLQYVYWLLDFYLQKFQLQLLSIFYYANFSSSYHDIDPDKEENGVHEKWLVENDFYKLLLIHSRFEILLMNLEKGCSQSRSNISEIQVRNLLTKKRLVKVVKNCSIFLRFHPQVPTSKWHVVV